MCAEVDKSECCCLKCFLSKPYISTCIIRPRVCISTPINPTK
jgi:hypothetical protein